MPKRAVAMYFSLSEPDEVSSPLGILENRFAALFEVRRIFWPRYEQFADPAAFDQGVAGFIDHILMANFTQFAELTGTWTGRPVRSARRRDTNSQILLDEAFLSGIDTLIIISFDSYRTGQRPDALELAAVRKFLEDPNHMVFVCPHHDIGNVEQLPPEQWLGRREAEFRHHGDPAIPPAQRFGGFGISLLNELGLEVRNRFGLRPAKASDGTPAPLRITAGADRLRLMEEVRTFNLHPHLPHFETIGDSASKFEVLARQTIDLGAPAHPFTAGGRDAFDALLQTKREVFAGSLFVCDATTWSSTAGGLEGLRRFWQNVALQ